MSTATISELHAKNSEFFKLLTPHRTTDVMQRINIFSVNRTGKKLPEYLNADGASESDKVKLVDELIAIVKEAQWEKLPEIPKGQAGNGTAPAPKPAPKAKLAPEPAAPTHTPPPAPVAPPIMPPLSEVMPLSEIPLPLYPNVVLQHPGVELEPDPMAIIAAQLARMQRPPVKQVTEAEVRRWVREELAAVLSTTAQVLLKK